jgi:hypothetical protein
LITKLETLKQLPDGLFTVTLLKSEDDIKNYVDGYFHITKSPKMIMLFVEAIDEINGKMSKNG